jgi:hypothetical protein
MSACVLLGAIACEPPPAPPAVVGPTAELTQRAVLTLLPGLQFGADAAQQTYREIRAADVAGAHYVPAANRWVVHYCVEFTNFASDAPQRRCDVNVEVYALDTKKWIGFARGAGTLYRWQVLEPAPKPEAKAASEPRPAQ